MRTDILDSKSTARRKEALSGKNTQSNAIENRRLLLHMIFENKEISRKELAEGSGLTAAAVTILVNSFIEEGLVEECGLKDIGGARKVRMLRMKNIYSVVSVRLHKTYFSIACFDIRQQKLYKNRIYCNIAENPEIVQRALETEVFNIQKLMQEEEIQILGIMLGVNGTFHIHEGCYQCLDAGSGKYYDFVGKLQEDVGLPVEINRNCNLCSYQLWKSVWGRRDGMIAAMLVSYSIECGAVINGEVLDGYQGRSGMIGDMRYIKEDKWKTFNEVASTTQLLERAAELKGQYPESLINLKDDFSIHDLTEAYNRNDALSRQVYDEMIEHYAEALARIANILNPDLFFIGGSIPLVKEYQIRIFEQVARIVFLDVNEICIEDDMESGIITLHMTGKSGILRFVSPEIEGTANDPVYGGVEYFVDASIEKENYFKGLKG